MGFEGREKKEASYQHTQISQSVAGVATIAGADEHTAAIIGDYGDAAVGMLGAWSVMRTAPLRYQEPTMTPSSQPRQLGDTGAKYRGGAGPELGSSETTVIGKTSGRPFNLDASGGSIRNLSTIGVKITARGLAVVEQHIARFAECPENSSMISRLRSIIAGDLQATQIDLNFYTHELREFVRYRRLGATSGDPGYEFWNNAHTATLEDYGLPGNTDRTLYVAP